MDYLAFATDTARAQFHPYRVHITLRNGSLIMLTLYVGSVGEAVEAARFRCTSNGWDASVIEVL